MAATLFAVAVAVAVAGAATTGWTKVDREHPGRLADASMATSTNPSGFVLSIVRSAGGGANLLFELSRDPEFLDESKGVQLSIDGGLRRELPRNEGSITWLESPVWDGSGSAELGVLRALMEGRSVEVDYYLNRGGYKSTSFDLSGLAPVVADLLAIPAHVSAEQKGVAAEREALLLDAGAACARIRSRKKRDKCIAESRVCLESAGDDLTALRSCLGID